MKAKKILLNVMTFFFCLCMFSFGAFAAQSASLTMTGTVGFIAHDCEVSLLGTVSNAIRGTEYNFAKVTNKTYEQQDGSVWADKLSVLNNDGKTLSDTPIEIVDGAEMSWCLGDIYFDDIYTDEILPIVLTLSVRNNSAYPINVVIDSENVVKDPNVEYNIPTDIKIEKDSVEQIQLSFTLINTNSDIPTVINFTNLNVEFQKYNPSQN